MIWSLTVWEPLRIPRRRAQGSCMPDQIDEEVKEDWQADIMELEEEVIFDKMRQ